MDNLNDLLKSATEGDGNVFEKIEKATGTYADKAADEKDVESKTAYGSLPGSVDPSPFTVGPLGSK
jgi:hypothetical protein